MASLVRQCTQCGAIDSKATWSSADEASKQGVFDGKWSCSSCAWTEFDLVDADESAREAQSSSTR
jgi:hypothetical protein